jgi:alkanesulfonate monooxygenase SsuD/methylene tetrahydromethanopterin reductase-like flavin-dependent oxidoreductase (luciferase family)
MNAVRVGIQLPEVERRVGWHEYLAIARAAEEVGLDSIWMGDHLLYRGDGRPERGPVDAWTMLAALAASTARMRLGPLVACTAFHPPGILARMASTIDAIAGGRFVLGLGAGWNETEFEAFGLPFDARASRFEEAFEIVRRLLDGERVTFAGRFDHVDDAVLLPRPDRRPELMIGSTGRRVLAVTLPHVDAWNTWYDLYGNTPHGLRREIAKVDEACERAGRDPRDIARSACVLVVFDRSAGERPVTQGVEPLEGGSGRIAAGIDELSEAGADEVIVVASPITEATVRMLGDAVALLRA